VVSVSTVGKYSLRSPAAVDAGAADVAADVGVAVPMTPAVAAAAERTYSTVVSAMLETAVVEF